MELSLSDRPLGRWLFGKLPAHGDFVARGLRTDLRDALDVWLMTGMEAAQTLYGDAFEQRYFAAPAWVFVDRDPAGQWSGGAMCASVDRVGRKFPVIAGTIAPDAAAAVQSAAQCQELLYAALSNRWSADQMMSADVTAPDPGWQSDAPAWAMIGEAGPPIVLAGRYPTGVIAAMTQVAA